MNRGVGILFLLLFVMLGSSVSAQTPFLSRQDNYVPAPKAGDVYDLYPRLVAEFMSKVEAIRTSS